MEWIIDGLWFFCIVYALIDIKQRLMRIEERQKTIMLMLVQLSNPSTRNALFEEVERGNIQTKR